MPASLLEHLSLAQARRRLHSARLYSLNHAKFQPSSLQPICEVGMSFFFLTILLLVTQTVEPALHCVLPWFWVMPRLFAISSQQFTDPPTACASILPFALIFLIMSAIIFMLCCCLGTPHITRNQNTYTGKGNNKPTQTHHVNKSQQDFEQEMA